MLEKATSKEPLLSATILTLAPENIISLWRRFCRAELTTMQNMHAMFPVKIHHVLLWSPYAKGVSLRFEMYIALEAW